MKKIFCDHCGKDIAEHNDRVVPCRFSDSTNEYEFDLCGQCLRKLDALVVEKFPLLSQALRRTAKAITRS